MKHLVVSLCASLCVLTLSQPCLAQANPWDGAWKIDASTMKYDGPTVSIASDAEGYTVTREGVAGPRIICDAKPHDTPTASVTCVKTGSGYKVDYAKDGKTLTKVTMTSAADGKTAVRTVERFPEDSKPYTITTYADLVSGGDGAPNVWHETKFTESNDTGILNIKVTGDTISFQETDSDQPFVCKLDGTPLNTGGDRTISVKAVGAHTLKVVYAAAGKMGRENTFILSPDGKSISETDLTPSPSSSKMSVMFTKS